MPPYSSQDHQTASRSSGAVTPYASHSPLSAIRPSRRAIVLGLLGVAGAVLPAQVAVAAPVQPVGPTVATNASANYSFTTLDNPADPTFNQLLGINDFGVIAGYFGSGFPAATHPSKGYLVAPYSGASFTNENYPGSQQTQVMAINDWGNTVGLYVNTAGAYFGFLDEGGVMTSVSDPNTTSKPAINELLGVNNQGTAVGFYNDARGNPHAYEWHRKTGVFTAIVPFGSSSATATAINDHGTVAGAYAEANGNQAGFILKGTTDMSIEFPGALDTLILGLNNEGTVVGKYISAQEQGHGFIYSAGVYKTIDDPDGVGGTLVNGLNNLGTVVGFYTDAKGNTDGFVAYPNAAGVPTP